MKILAIKWRRLGDTVLWTSALEALVQHFPGASIDIALPDEYQELFAGDPRFRACFRLSTDWNSQVHLIRQWRKEHYNYVLVFHANRKSLILAYASGAQNRLIHHHSERKKNYGSQMDIKNLGKVMPATERDLNLVRTLGWNGKAPETRILPPPEWKQRAKNRWQKEAGFAPEAPFVLVTGASRPAKRWPLERFVELVERLPDGRQAAVLTPSLREFCGQGRLLRRLQERATVVETPRLKDAIGLLQLGRVFIGSDSGMKHLAIALGIPTLTFFGPESVGEWHPYPASGNAILQTPVLCRKQGPADPRFGWCGAHTCPLGSHACLSTITVDDAVTKLQPYF